MVKRKKIVTHVSLETFARMFFRARFLRNPDSDKEYFKEWKKRLGSVYPTAHMDSTSLKVYKRILKRYRY